MTETALAATEPRELILLANATDVLGGVTAWTHQMARLFGAHGHRVQVVGIHEAELKLTLPEPPAYPVTALYPTHPPTPWRPRSPLSFFDLAARRRESARVADRRRAVARLSEIFRAAGPGALVIVTQVWPMEWVLEADTTGLRLIGMSHESYEYSKRCHRFRWIKNSYPHVDRWLTLTQEDADAWIAEGFDNVGALPNALGSLPELPSPHGEDRRQHRQAGRPEGHRPAPGDLGLGGRAAARLAPADLRRRPGRRRTEEAVHGART